MKVLNILNNTTYIINDVIDIAEQVFEIATLNNIVIFIDLKFYRLLTPEQKCTLDTYCKNESEYTPMEMAKMHALTVKTDDEFSVSEFIHLMDRFCIEYTKDKIKHDYFIIIDI